MDTIPLNLCSPSSHQTLDQAFPGLLTDSQKSCLCNSCQTKYDVALKAASALSPSMNPDTMTPYQTQQLLNRPEFKDFLKCASGCAGVDNIYRKASCGMDCMASSPSCSPPTLNQNVCAVHMIKCANECLKCDVDISSQTSSQTISQNVDCTQYCSPCSANTTNNSTTTSSQDSSSSSGEKNSCNQDTKSVPIYIFLIGLGFCLVIGFVSGAFVNSTSKPTPSS